MQHNFWTLHWFDPPPPLNDVQKTAQLAKAGFPYMSRRKTCGRRCFPENLLDLRHLCSKSIKQNHCITKYFINMTIQHRLLSQNKSMCCINITFWFCIISFWGEGPNVTFIQNPELLIMVSFQNCPLFGEQRNGTDVW